MTNLIFYKDSQWEDDSEPTRGTVISAVPFCGTYRFLDDMLRMEEEHMDELDESDEGDDPDKEVENEFDIVEWVKEAWLENGVDVVLSKLLDMEVELKLKALHNPREFNYDDTRIYCEIPVEVAEALVEQYGSEDLYEDIYSAILEYQGKESEVDWIEFYQECSALRSINEYINPKR